LIIVDSKEKTKCNEGCAADCIHKLLLATADKVASLRVDHEGVARFYDLEVTTKANQVLRFEAKWSFADAYSTYMEREEDGHSRLTRQLRYVDCCIMVLDDFQVELEIRPEQRPAYKGMKNWLRKRTLLADPPILVFPSVVEVLDFLKYLEGQKEILQLAPRPGSIVINGENGSVCL
jgi:hypothetical protein